MLQNRPKKDKMGGAGGGRDALGFEPERERPTVSREMTDFGAAGQELTSKRFPSPVMIMT